MIKNIVFDLGRVLIDWEAKKYIKSFGYDDETVDKLNEIIFTSEEWLDCDKGKYERNTDLVEMLSKKYPEHAEKIAKILTKDWVKILKLKEDSSEYLINLKQQGFKIYILSNLSKESYDHNSKYEFFKYIDGGIYSFESKKIKPDHRIYIELLEKYNLVPEETIFIDDIEENVNIANDLKINGIIFNNLEQVKKDVERVIENNK